MGLPEEYVLPNNYNEAYHLAGDGVVAQPFQELRRLARRRLRWLPRYPHEPERVRGKTATRLGSENMRPPTISVSLGPPKKILRYAE